MARRRAAKKPKNQGIDATPGGLLWVRLKNGAWWPGQILDPNQLPVEFGPIPRRGTPVQFLGREDASVEWFNLERSTRVKPFHCKEYKYCILRAQSSATGPYDNRAINYASREDAILHALELERARLGRNQLDLNAAVDAQGCDDDEKDSELGQEDGPGHVDSANEEREAENDSEDDGVKRMRGLEDLGVGLATTRERKPSQVGHVKCRPLTKVMERSTMVPVFAAPSSAGEDSNESKRNSSVVINNNSDSTGVSSENASLKRKLKGGAEKGSFRMPVTKRKNSAVIVSDGSRKKQRRGGGQSSGRSHAEAGTSRSGTVVAKDTVGWVLKGRRGARTRRRYPNLKIQTSSAARSGRGGSRRNRPQGGTVKVKSEYPTEQPALAPAPAPALAPAPAPAPQRLLPVRQSRFMINPKYENADYALDTQAASSLHEVKVEVKTSYRPQHVPYVSLVSQSTGLPVTGYHIEVDVLKDGSCDQIPKFVPDLNEDKAAVAPANAGKSKGRGGNSKPKGGSSRARTSTPRSKSRSGGQSKKTRKLSSLTGGRGLSYEEMKDVKPIVEKPKSTSVACVPLKVVFSRLNAALK